MGRAISVNLVTKETSFRHHNESFAYSVTESSQNRGIQKRFQRFKMLNHTLGRFRIPRSKIGRPGGIIRLGRNFTLSEVSNAAWLLDNMEDRVQFDIECCFSWVYNAAQCSKGKR